MEESGGSEYLLVHEFEALFEDNVRYHEYWVYLEAVFVIFLIKLEIKNITIRFTLKY